MKENNTVITYDINTKDTKSTSDRAAEYIKQIKKIKTEGGEK